MSALYEKNTANAQQPQADTFFAEPENACQYRGFLDDTFRYIEDFQLLKPQLWRRFVQQFRQDSDGADAGWRGEYWGKMMRGACFVYAYTQNETLYGILAQTVLDMMDSAEESGRISSYAVKREFDGWDIWSRKYVLLGMQYFLEICKDPALGRQIVDSMRGQADSILSKIGPKEEGKKPITAATRHWRGLNSSSLLEPVVRLYSLTGEKRYLDFAGYIVESGGTDVANIFELAYRNDFYPYQYPVTKAYEMISCFEGLLEYYRVTGTPWHRQALIRFADRVLESDFTVIGCCGCTHELFDHSTVRQANTTNGEILQETCVTVTLMKFLWQMNRLTGDPKYADAFEISLYNAYLGAVNTEKRVEPSIPLLHPDWTVEPLPFDSYSPLTAGTRGNGVGGLKVMRDGHYYGCCACIGAAGIGLAPKMQLLSAEDGLVMNLFIDGTAQAQTPGGGKAVLETRTAYPRDGAVAVTVRLERPEAFTLRIRNPGWSKNTAVSVNGEKVEAAKGYICIHRQWRDGDRVEIALDMRTEALRPIPYGEQILMNKVVWGHNYMVPTYDREDPLAHRHLALRRGPVMLAQESRLGYRVEDPVSIRVNEDGTVDAALPQQDRAPYPHILEMRIPLTDGRFMTVTDYASAGKLWAKESKMAVWMRTE